MRTVTLHTATTNLQNLIADTLSNQEETVIVTDTGSVVMIDQQNWNGILETLKLLKDEKSLKALLEGHKERSVKGKSKGKSVEEVFTYV
ncbi:MAG: hypothetical protein K9H64_12845 [Bacteroidales bacterium]|nr:hypothetical protein [Bacteroidales bacterium]MCF8456934.1 hypothetical protein [Bacteroidales bacterium]